MLTNYDVNTAVRGVLDWVYRDTLVYDLDPLRVEESIRADNAMNCLDGFSDDDIADLVCGSPDEDPRVNELAALWPRLDAYLNSELS